MNKKVKKLWLKALRSGKYKQGKNQLKDGDRYCCLGVLCDIYAKTNKKRGFDLNGRFQKELTFPSKKVIKWAGLSSINPYVFINKKETTLADLNDTGKSFKYIADVIEKGL